MANEIETAGRWWPIMLRFRTLSSLFFPFLCPVFSPQPPPASSSRDPWRPQGPLRARWHYLFIPPPPPRSCVGVCVCMLACLCLPRQLTTGAYTEPWESLGVLAPQKTCEDVPSISHAHTHTDTQILEAPSLSGLIIHSEGPYPNC